MMALTEVSRAENRVLAIAGLALGAVACLVLAGWVSGTTILVTILPGASPMVVNTALGFLLLGGGLFRFAAGDRRTPQIMGGLVAVLGCVIIAQYVSGVALGIDELLWRQRLGVAMSVPGRMGPNTALAFVLGGVALGMLGRFSAAPPRRLLAWLSGVILGVALLSLLGYACGVKSAYAWGRLTGMSVPTALNLTVFAGAILHYMNKRTRGRDNALPLFAVALVLLTAAAVFSYLANGELLRANQWVYHTVQVRESLGRVRARLTETEAWARIHDALEDDRSGAAFRQSALQLQQSLVETRELLRDNAAQLARIDALRDQCERRLGEFGQWFAQPGLGAAATEDVAARPADGLIGQMLEEEARLLTARNAQAQELARQSKLISVLGNGIGVALIVAAYYFSRRAQARLRDSELRFATLAARVPVGIYMGDRIHGCTYVNPHWCDLSGITPEEAMGEGWIKFLHPDERDRVLAAWPEHPEPGSTFTLEYRAQAKDGRVLNVIGHATYLPPASNRALTYIGTVTDITGLKKLEGDLRAAKEHAEAADRAKSAFLANMSHEIRTPMNGIVGFGALLLSTDITPQQREWISYINANGQALLDIINDILDLSKIEAGRLSLSPAPFVLKTVLDEAVITLLPRAQAKNLVLEAQMAPSLPAHWIGDAGRLRQILINLAGNAVKFTERGGVFISVEPASGQPTGGSRRLSFKVRDTGIGIPEEVQRRLFARFTQADESTTRKYGGTGLGLSISKALVEQMGGAVELDSLPGEGSTFSFTIELEVDQTPVALASDPRPAARTRNFKGVRIMVAEDNAVNRKLLEGQLRQLGLTATFVSDGAELLDRVRTEAYDVILMDVDMPVLDGIETTRRLRATPHFATSAEVPIVALTAHAMGGDRDRCLAAGMTDYLSKPTKLDLLAAAIARATAKPEEF